MTRRSRCTKQVVDSFWQRWQKEYLLSLRESHWMSSQEEAKVHAGDVVCVKEDGIKRRRWQIGRVTEIIRGSDGVVRGAKLQVVSEKNKKRQTISRPLQLLYPLEVKTEDDSSKWPKRIAAVDDQVRRRLIQSIDDGADQMD